MGKWVHWSMIIPGWKKRLPNTSKWVVWIDAMSDPDSPIRTTSETWMCKGLRQREGIPSKEIHPIKMLNLSLPRGKWNPHYLPFKKGYGAEPREFIPFGETNPGEAQISPQQHKLWMQELGGPHVLSWDLSKGNKMLRAKRLSGKFLKGLLTHRANAV